MRLLAPLIVAATLVVPAACAAGATGPGAARRFDRFQSTVTSDLTGYESVYFPPVEASDEIQQRIDYRPQSSVDRVRPLTRRELQKQLTDFETQLRDAVSRVATVVGEPGSGVLTIAVVLTRLEADRPTEAELRGLPGVDPGSRYAGRAGAVVIFKEGRTVLAEASDFGSGALDTGAAGATWSEARRFFGSFSSKVTALLE